MYVALRMVAKILGTNLVVLVSVVDPVNIFLVVIYMSALQKCYEINERLQSVKAAEAMVAEM